LTPKATPTTAKREKKETFLWEGNNCFHARKRGQGIFTNQRLNEKEF
jgi:hypothetical protein